jgi:pilus assembly protein FimV
MARKLATVVLSLGCLNASSALALGLGDLTLDSFLNEPLKAQVNLLNTGSLHQDQIRIRLATKDDFEKMGVDRAYFLTSISFEVQLDGSGRGQILITSDDPVLEPYLDFIVEARWPSGRLLREYTVLIDPPVFDESVNVISATSRVMQVEGGEQVLAEEIKKKTSESSVQRTGTHVDVARSDLPSGQMPRRDYGSDAALAPAPGERYMISRDDTLWEIALEARPQGATVQQTMLDIQRLNPQAFIDNNINRIKAGYVIYLPAAAEISSGDESTATAEVAKQNEDWREGRPSDGYASSGPALRIAADSGEEGDATAVDAGASPEGEGAGETGQAAAGAAALEDLDKAALENAEMTDRLESMEQQVETLERIVSLKDEQIAALQNALSEAGVPAEEGETGEIEDLSGLVGQVPDEGAGELEPAQSGEGEEAASDDAAETGSTPTAMSGTEDEVPRSPDRSRLLRAPPPRRVVV